MPWRPRGEVEVQLSLTAALDGGGWSTPRSGRFTPRKDTRYPLYRSLGGPQGRSGWVRKTSPPSGFDPRNVQPVASHHADCDIPTHDMGSYVHVLLSLPASWWRVQLESERYHIRIQAGLPPIRRGVRDVLSHFTSLPAQETCYDHLLRNLYVSTIRDHIRVVSVL